MSRIPAYLLSDALLILLKSIGECVIHPVDRSYLVLRYKIAAEQKRRRK